jgi:hypothetical protein
MIPASQLNPQALQTLYQYLRTEITKALGERAPLEEAWAKYHFSYKGRPEFAEKDFPFVGAANLVLPVIATDVDTIYSRLMGILFATENLWSCRPLNDMMVDFAPRLQEFLEWAQHNELEVYDAVADYVLELTKLGTGILKQRYTRESKRVYQFRESDMGTIEQHLTLLLKDHPTLEHVSLVDFLVPASAKSIKDAPWCAERISLTWGQFQNRVRAGIYQGGNQLREWWARDRGAQLDQLRQRLDLFEPGLGDRFELWECWLDYDITGIGEPQAIVCTIHLPTMTVLRIDYNPFFNQEKPYSFSRYLRQEKRFYGIGLCEMLDQFQAEISTMHNQRLDNATLANSTMYAARKNSGIRENEPVIPGRWFLLDDPQNDIKVLNMGQRYDSTVQYENLTLSYARSRTGVSDYISGADNNSIGYGAATTAVQMLREGAKRFDQVLRECRICLGESGTRIVELYQQFNQHGKEYLAMGPHDGALVHQILQFPLELIRTGVGVELTATSAQLNKEVEIRTNQIVMQMLMQFYQQIMQGMSFVMNPQVPPQMQQLAMQMVQGGTILMRRILDNYGIQDADRLIPALDGAINGGQQQLDSLVAAIRSGQIGNSGAAPAGGMAYPGQGYPGVGTPGLPQPSQGGYPIGLLPAPR